MWRLQNFRADKIKRNVFRSCCMWVEFHVTTRCPLLLRYTWQGSSPKEEKTP